MRPILSLFGVYDNLNDPPEFLNSTRNILGVTISCMIVTWTCALLRLYVRFIVVRAPGWDDLFVTLSLLSTTAGTVSIVVATSYCGMGQHFLLITPVEQLRYLKIFYIANATYPCSAGWVKLALLLQYLRAYGKTSRLRKWIIAAIVVVAGWCLSYGYLGWIPCLPVQAYWDLTVPAVRYGFSSIYVEPFVMTYVGLTTTNMILDLVILGLAAPLLLGRQQEKVQESKRWALVSLFCVGSVASILSIWRLAAIVRTQATTHPTFDPTWYGPTPIVLAALEVDVAVISAALPVFWPVLRNLNLKLNITVTREVKVTLEQRCLSKYYHRSGGPGCSSHGSTSTRGGGGGGAAGDSHLHDPDDDAIELHRSQSGLQQRCCSEESTSNRNDHYQDPYVQQQVDPLRRAEMGTISQVGAALPPERKGSIVKVLRKQSRSS